MMHKIFYASGFLYHIPSQQILLQQQTLHSPTSTPIWSLIKGEHNEQEQPDEVFRKTVHSLLHTKIDLVYPVYAYLNEDTGENHSILYSELDELKNFPSKNGLTFCWFSFKDILKLSTTQQTKHDIVVGQRVIDAAARKDRGEHTLQ